MGKILDFLDRNDRVGLIVVAFGVVFFAIIMYVSLQPVWKSLLYTYYGIIMFIGGMFQLLG